MKWIKTSLFAVPVALAFVLCFVKIDDYDVWWHLKCGELFLQHGWIPRTEIFSFTAEGAPWVDGYLPMQAIMYACWALAGPAGVIILGSLMSAAIYALALAMSRNSGKGFALALAVAGPAAIFGRDQATTRPALITPLFALITVWLLEKFAKRDDRIIYWTIPLTLFWANSHPAFFLAPAITFIYAASFFVRGWRENDADETRYAKRLLTVIACQIAATFVNPYGYKIYYSLTAFATSPFLKNYIVEWLPLFDEPHGPPEGGYIFVGLCVLFGAVSIVFRKTLKLELFVLFVFIAVSTYFGRRNVMLMGALSLPLLAWTASDEETWERLPDSVYRAAAPLGVVLCVAEIFFVWFAASNLFYILTPQYGYRSTGVGVHGASLPVNAVKLLKDEHIAGNIFHNLDAGGYILFNLYPQNRVLVDGRCYPYPIDVFEDMDVSFEARSRFDKVADKYGINIAMLSVARDDNQKLILSLLQDPNWAMVMADEISALFLRVAPATEATIKKYGRGAMPGPGLFASHHPDGRWGLFERRDYPDGAIRWGAFYSRAGRPDMAVAMLEPFINTTPGMGWLKAWYESDLRKAQKQTGPR